MLASEERPLACVCGIGGRVRVGGAVGPLDAVQGLHPHDSGDSASPAKTPGDPSSPQGTYSPSLVT